MLLTPAQERLHKPLNLFSKKVKLPAGIRNIRSQGKHIFPLFTLLDFSLNFKMLLTLMLVEKWRIFNKAIRDGFSLLNLFEDFFSESSSRSMRIYLETCPKIQYQMYQAVYQAFLYNFIAVTEKLDRPFGLINLSILFSTDITSVCGS